MIIDGFELLFLGHSGFLIKTENGQKIVIDPYNVSNNVEKVELILITHNHYDHCSIKDIQKLSKKGTLIVLPPDAQSKITKIQDIQMEIVEVGDKINFRNFKIETFPAYNLNKKYHPKSDGCFGFLIKFNGLVFYHAGDSDLIPEMEKLTGYGKHGNKFIVMLPVSGKVVMNVDEAVEAACLIKPDLVIPMHYGAGVVGTVEDAKKFVRICAEKKINGEVLEKI